MRRSVRKTGDCASVTIHDIEGSTIYFPLPRKLDRFRPGEQSEIFMWQKFRLYLPLEEEKHGRSSNLTEARQELTSLIVTLYVRAAIP